MVRLLSGLQVWQICENYFLFIVLKADGKALSSELRPRKWRVLQEQDLPRPLILAINIELFSHLFFVAPFVVVLIICSLKLHLHMAHKYRCALSSFFFFCGGCEQLLFSHHNHKRYKHNYYFYVPATYCKAANCLTTHKIPPGKDPAWELSFMKSQTA